MAVIAKKHFLLSYLKTLSVTYVHTFRLCKAASICSDMSSNFLLSLAHISRHLDKDSSHKRELKQIYNHPSFYYKPYDHYAPQNSDRYSCLKFVFSTYSACVIYQLFQCLIHAVRLFRETLPVAPTVRFTSTVMHDMANMLQRQIFQFPPGRDTADFVSSGRLRELKNNRKF